MADSPNSSIVCYDDWRPIEETIRVDNNGLITTLVETAWQCNPESLALLDVIDAGGARIRQSRASLLPNVSLSSDYNDTSYKLEEDSDSKHRQRSSTLQGTLRVPLFKPQALQALDASHIESVDTELALQEHQSELAMSIIDSVLNLIALTEDIRVLEAQVASNNEQVHINKRRLEGGLGSITDIVETQLRLRLAQTQLKIQRSDQEQRKLELAKQIGKQRLTLGSVNIESKLPAIAPEDIKMATESMMRDNLTLQRAQNNVSLAEANIRVQNRGHWPTLDLVATSSNSRYFKYAGTTASNSASTTYMLQFELPLYSGGSTSAHEAEAQALSRKAKQELHSAQISAVTELRRHYEESELHRERVTMNEHSLSDAQRLLTITRKAFRAGNRSNIDVLNAQQQVSDAGGELIKSRVDYLRSQAQILKLLGKLVDKPTLQLIDTALIISN
ncbi:MAG: TolC family protein [Candidatus Thiodiazotropha sp.]